MAVAVYTSDLTIVVDIDSTVHTSNWASIGGGASGLSAEQDYFIQSDGCVSKNAFRNTTRGMVEDTTNTLLTTGDLSALYIWMTHHTPASLSSKATGGLTVLMGSNRNNLNRYFYAGSDTIDYGAPWICAVVDPENATANSGSIAHSAIDTYGIEANLIGGPNKGSPLGVDTMRQGRSYDVTAGDVATPATFAEAAAKNDLNANRYGQFQSAKGGYTMQCRFGLGTVATAAYFEDSNVAIVLEDLEFVDPDFIEFEVVNSGTTVKWSNITITSLGSLTRGSFLVTSSTLVEHTTCTFIDMGTFTYDSTSVLTNTVFRRCDQVTGGVLTGCTIEQSINASATSYDNLDDLINCSFIGDSTGHAVEMPTLITTNTAIGWDCTFDTTTYATVDGSTGNEVIKCNVDTGIILTINVSSTGTTPTIYNTGAGTVNVVAGQATIKIICKDNLSKVAIQGVGIIVRATTEGNQPFEDSVTIAITVPSSSGTATVTHTGHTLSSGHFIEILGANEAAYNKVKEITVIDANTYTYAIASGTTSPATGTITATSIIIFGNTDINGEILDTRGYSINQGVLGDARKGSESPTYISSQITGTIDSANGATINILMTTDD